MLSVEELNDRLIDLAFAEDIGDGDHTTLCCIPADAIGESKLLIKEEGIFAGVEIAKEVFRRFDPELQVEVYVEDGAHVMPGDIVMSVKGREQSLLQTERLMLNILQRMSGIATMTHKYQQALIDAGTIVHARRAQKYMDEGDIETVYKLFADYEDVVDFAKVVTEDEIAAKGYTLSVNTYIEKTPPKPIDPKEVRANYMRAYQNVIDCEEKLKTLLRNGGYIE